MKQRTLQFQIAALCLGGLAASTPLAQADIIITFDTTPAELKNLLEHGAASWPNQGRLPQVGGVAFAWDPSLPANSRVLTISLIGEDGLLIQASGANVTLTLPLQKSTTIGGWEPADADLEASFPKIENKEFYRVILPQ